MSEIWYNGLVDANGEKPCFILQYACSTNPPFASTTTWQGLVEYRVNEVDMKLGVLCKRKHEYKDTGKSMRDPFGHCLKCRLEKYHATKNIPSVKERLIAQSKRYAAKNAEKITLSLKAYRENHRDELRKRARDAYHRDEDKARRLNKERREKKPDLYRAIGRDSRRRLRAENPDKARQYSRDYYKSNTVKIKLRSRLYRAFRMFTSSGKIMSSDQYGIDYEAIIKHLGKCPGSQKDWHIDHIRPLASFDFSDPEQVKAAFAPENHQWLPAKENLIKNSKVAV